jgi:hypothetical protein
LQEGGTGGKPTRRGLTVRQGELAHYGESLLGAEWVNDAGKWVERIKAQPEKVGRVFDEVAALKRARQIRKTVAGCAEDLWGRFK